MGEQAAAALVMPTATLLMLRMARDELGFRPLAVAGELLGGVSEAEVLAAPKVSSEGVFGNFRVPAEGVQHEWVVSFDAPPRRAARGCAALCYLCIQSLACVSTPEAEAEAESFLVPCLAHAAAFCPPACRPLQALPNWSIITLAVHPVVLTVADCALVPQIVLSSSAKVRPPVPARLRLPVPACAAAAGVSLPACLSSHVPELETHCSLLLAAAHRCFRCCCRLRTSCARCRAWGC